MDDALLDRFRRKDRTALARLLTLAARGELDSSFVLRPPALEQGGKDEAQSTKGEGRARVVAVTGSGGVGKSTLIGKLIELIRKQNLKVAVLACDPQSPLSGGALLGDRFRMPTAPDDGVFIRSLAAMSGHGAVADHLDLMVRLLESFGFDVILIETAGAGQGDVAARDLADVVVLLLQPETGDDLQWEKAGVLEVADIVVIHKADLPGAEQAAAQVRATLDLSVGHAASVPARAPVPVLKVSGKTGAGLPELWTAILALPARRDTTPSGAGHLLRLAYESLTRRFAHARNDPALSQLFARWQQGVLSSDQAGAAVLALLAK